MLTACLCGRCYGRFLHFGHNVAVRNHHGRCVRCCCTRVWEQYLTQLYLFRDFVVICWVLVACEGRGHWCVYHDPCPCGTHPSSMTDYCYKNSTKWPEEEQGVTQMLVLTSPRWTKVTLIGMTLTVLLVPASWLPLKAPSTMSLARGWTTSTAPSPSWCSSTSVWWMSSAMQDTSDRLEAAVSTLLPSITRHMSQLAEGLARKQLEADVHSRK